MSDDGSQGEGRITHDTSCANLAGYQPCRLVIFRPSGESPHDVGQVDGIVSSNVSISTEHVLERSRI